jgi:hypothetical protein
MEKNKSFHISEIQNSVNLVRVSIIIKTRKMRQESAWYGYPWSLVLNTKHCSSVFICLMLLHQISVASAIGDYITAWLGFIVSVVFVRIEKLV